MRLLVLALALLTLASCPGLLTAQASSSPVCRKNIVIYFDTSDSMKNPAAGTNLPIRNLMLEFLRQALDSPQLVSETDSLKIKLFVGDPQQAWSSNSRLLIQQVKLEAYNAVKPTITKGEPGDNNFVNLEKDVKNELDRLKPEPNTTTYILVFSDFFYNPSLKSRQGRSREVAWGQQRDEFSKRLADLSSLFDRKKAKLIYWYQRNNGTDGTDLGDLLTGQDYLRQIETSASIPGLVDSISKEFRASLHTSAAQFLYSREGLNLNITLNNTNCFPVALQKLAVGQIGSTDIREPLADGANADYSSKITDQGSQVPVSIALRGVPDLHTLKTKYLNHTYTVKVTTTSDAGISNSTFQIPLTEDAFREAVDIKTTEAVLVKHILHRSERIFLQLVLNGNLFEEKPVKVTASLPEKELTTVDPGQGSYAITPDDITLPRVLIFSFPDIDQELRWESSGSKVFSLSVAVGTQSPRTLAIKISKTKDYRPAEWAILILMLTAGVSIRAYYARQTRQR
jgi:hypothetical protein